MSPRQWDRSSIERWMASAARVPLLAAAEELHLGALVQSWQQHEDGPDHAPPGIRRRGIRARNRMMAANLRLVATVVMKSKTRLEFDDACQAATLGLQRAVEKFDPTRGYKFSTYAYWWIRQSITRADEDLSNAIRLPNQVFERQVRLNRLIADLQQQLGRQPTVAELAEGFGVSAEEVLNVLNLPSCRVSLDVAVGDGNAKLGDYLPDPASDDQTERLEIALRADRLRAALIQMDASNPNGARLLRELFALDGGEPMTLAAIGRRRGISREAIRQARDRALLQLRGLMLRLDLQGQLDL